MKSPKRGAARPTRKGSQLADYAVGYRRPPKTTQFKAGKSGNPKGRPKGSRPRVLVEDTGAGTSLVQELKGSISGIIAVKPEGDKLSRMSVASAKKDHRRTVLHGGSRALFART